MIYKFIKKTLKKIILNFFNFFFYIYKKILFKKFYKKYYTTFKINNYKSIGFHYITSHKDLHLCICSVISLIFFSNSNLNLYFHDDGTLQNKDISTLKKLFPSANIILRKDADKLISSKLNFPKINSWRKKYVYSLKIIDTYIFNKEEFICLIDSDVLFFNKPDFILTYKSDSFSFNKDLDNAYISSTENLYNATGVRVKEKINSGLWISPKKLIDLNYVEEVLSNKKFNLLIPNRPHVQEQTIIALIGSKINKIKHLPQTYDVSLSKLPRNNTTKHYVGIIRNKFFLEGINYLNNEKKNINKL